MINFLFAAKKANPQADTSELKARHSGLVSQSAFGMAILLGVMKKII